MKKLINSNLASARPCRCSFENANLTASCIIPIENAIDENKNYSLQEVLSLVEDWNPGIRKAVMEDASYCCDNTVEIFDSMEFGGLLKTKKWAHNISDPSGQKKGKFYFVAVQTLKSLTLFCPGLKSQDKAKVNERLCEYEKNNPSDTTIPTLRQVAKSLWVREASFPEFSWLFHPELTIAIIMTAHQKTFRI